MELKSYCLVTDLQPQYAAFIAATGAARSSIPAPGDSVLTIDFGGSLAVEGLLDKLLKDSSLAAISGLAIERQGSAFEFSGPSTADIELVAKTALRLAGVSPLASAETKQGSAIGATQLIKDVAPLQATLINRSRRGTMVAAGDAVLIFECETAYLTGKLFNDIEKSFPELALIDIDDRGGRIILTAQVDILKKVQKYCA
ncbi:MAG: hypothetical protein V7711_12765 [Pseudomonadales bacterium]